MPKPASTLTIANIAIAGSPPIVTSRAVAERLRIDGWIARVADGNYAAHYVAHQRVDLDRLLVRVSLLQEELSKKPSRHACPDCGAMHQVAIRTAKQGRP